MNVDNNSSNTSTIYIVILLLAILAGVILGRKILSSKHKTEENKPIRIIEAELVKD